MNIHATMFFSKPGVSLRQTVVYALGLMSVSDVGVVLSSVRVQSSESVGRREAAGLTRISNGGLAHPPFKLTAQ